MRHGLVALLACLAITASSAEALVEAPFTPTTVAIDKIALISLTTPTQAGRCPAPTVRVTFSDAKPWKGVTISGSLSFATGPSFQNTEASVLSFLDNVVGDITISRGGAAQRWHVAQFNFLNQAARCNYTRAKSSLAALLPVILTADKQPDVHAFLVLKGTVERDRIIWRKLDFGFEEMVAKAFPGSPGIETVIGPMAVASH
jgi:hypothetical protein